MGAEWQVAEKGEEATSQTLTSRKDSEDGNRDKCVLGQGVGQGPNFSVSQSPPSSPQTNKEQGKSKGNKTRAASI